MSNKLLLADDSITIRKVVGIIFANEDYALSVVDNGNAALEKAREILPDIIMADVMMPGKTGYEVCVEVRGDPALRHIPLLLMTGAFEPFDEDRARQSGADDFISKPFESQQLMEKVKALLALGEERKTGLVAPEPAVPEFVAIEPAGVVEPPITQAQFAPPAASAAPPGELTEVFLQTEEPVAKPVLQVDDITVPEDVVETLSEDDLWDVFTLEEEVEEEIVEPEAVLEEEIGVSFGEQETVGDISLTEPGGGSLAAAGPEVSSMPPLEADIFAIEEEELALDMEEPPPAEELIGEAFEFAAESRDERTFVLGLDEPEPDAVGIAGIPEVELQMTPEEEPAPASAPAEILSGGVFEIVGEPEMQMPFTSGQEEPLPVVAPATPEIELQFAPEEEYVPVIPDVSSPAPVVQQTAPETPRPAAAEVPQLSEERLAAVVANISRDIIERIVWEVVPDLAETLIRDEIKKLKEGLRR
ncbi:MAG TPA: response regulator [Geobacteraceae bacterium]|nr:response regulator [Geobacteraceae bacterium]